MQGRAILLIDRQLSSWRAGFDDLRMAVAYDYDGLCDRHGRQTLHQISSFFSLIALLTVSACGPAAEDPAPEAADIEPESTDRSCIDGGRLEAELYGAVQGRIDWSGPGVSCEGMPRPDSEGARLRFAGDHTDGELALIVALPGYARRLEGEALTTRLTIIEEGGGRFFATGEAESCWTDIMSNEVISESVEKVSGRIYCIRPLSQVNGENTLNLRNLEFTGFVDWSAS